MLLERTASQLDVGSVPPNQAEKLGQLGFLKWLCALHGDADYVAEVRCAFEATEPFRAQSPAVVAFCRLLLASSERPPRTLAFLPTPPSRQGGARARRRAR